MIPWPSVALGNIFEIARGGSPRPIQNFITEDPDGVNWIMIGDASESSKYITSTKRKILQSGVSRSRMVHAGDFLLTNSMSFGRPYIVQTPGCIHDGWLVLSARNGGVDQDYFYHLLGSDLVYAEFERRAAGATVKNLNIDLVKGVEVPFPPTHEQKRIAAILDQADSLRRLSLRTVEYLNRMGQAIFNDIFHNQNDPTRLGALIERIESGKNLVADDSSATGGYRVLKVSAIGRAGFNPAETKPLPPDYVPPSAHLVQKGDLLFSRANTAELVGLVAIVDEIQPNTALPDKLWRLIPNKHCATAIFLEQLFKQPSIRAQLERVCSGTSGSMKNISMSKLAAITVPCPPLELQEQFGKRIEAVNALRTAAKRQASEFERLFATLQHRAFRADL